MLGPGIGTRDRGCCSFRGRKSAMQRGRWLPWFDGLIPGGGKARLEGKAAKVWRDKTRGVASVETVRCLQVGLFKGS